jgi:hypothetical protein
VARRTQIDIAGDLASLPLPPEELWLRRERRDGLRREQVGIGAIIVGLAFVVGLPLAAGVGRDGPAAQSSRATTLPASFVGVSPGQIDATARLVPIDQVTNIPIRGPWNYVVDMTLTNQAPDGDYAIDVYPYAAGASAGVLDFGAGFDASGRVIGGAGITSGSNGWRLRAAAAALRAATPPVAVANDWHTEGISFVGNRGTVRVRFAVTLPSPASLGAAENYRLVIVYSPHNGDVIAWTRVVPVTIDVRR